VPVGKHLAVTAFAICVQTTLLFTASSVCAAKGAAQKKVGTKPASFQLWSDVPPARLEGLNRMKECCQLLRQYQLIGMDKKQVLKLLGKPDHRPETNDCDSYRLSWSCGGQHWLAIKYQDDKIAAYTVTGGQKNVYWIQTKCKLERDQDLQDFCRENGTLSQSSAREP
jgi:hypothetical protein